MKITRIECIPITIPIKSRVVMSGGPLLGSTLVLVKMHTDEGITGIADSGGTSELEANCQNVGPGTGSISVDPLILSVDY